MLWGPETAKRYFRGGWDHFHAEGSGLRDAPGRDDDCPFITCEDSGTTGLTGDIEQFHEVPGVRNPFYYFFRAEGQSNKLETGRGRWGLGKFVFPRSSAIRSFFGLTVRHDDRKRLLVGQSILRSHHVEDKNYTPDGWFGEKPDKDETSMPVDDPEFIDQFEADFCLERKRDPGLSLVVPYCDTTWTPEAVIESVVQDYFYVILRDELVVTVESRESSTVVNSRTLPGIVETASESLRLAIRPLLELTQWVLTTKSAATMIFSGGSSLTKWNQKSIAPNQLASLKRAFHDAGRVLIRVPVDVQHRQGVTRPTYLRSISNDSKGLSRRDLCSSVTGLSFRMFGVG